MSQGRRIATLSIMLALSMLMSYVEVIIPFTVGVPGMKIGLANIVIVLAIYGFNARDAFLINMIRIITVGILFGSIMSMTYSLFGGIFSFFAMLLSVKVLKLKVITTSIIGGMAHNVGQMAAALLYFKVDYLVFYTPILLVAGFVSGFLTGYVAFVLRKRLNNVFLY